MAQKVALSANIPAWAAHPDMQARLPEQKYLHMIPDGLGLEDVMKGSVSLIDPGENYL